MAITRPTPSSAWAWTASLARPRTSSPAARLHRLRNRSILAHRRPVCPEQTAVRKEREAGSSGLPHQAPIPRELQAAEAAALKEVADRIGLELGLLCHGVLAVVLGVPRGAVAVIVSSMVIPPAPLVPGGPVEDLEAQVRVLEADVDELGKVLRLEPDRQPALVDRNFTHITDPDA